MCCQENESYLTSVFPKSHSFAKFWRAWLPTHLDRKSLFILQSESQSMNSFLKMESYLLPYGDQLSRTHLVAQTEVEHSLVQRLWSVFFREMVLALISPWFTVKVDGG